MLTFKNISVHVLIISLLVLAGCAGPRQTATTDQVEELVQVSLKVEKENLRDAPNGTKVGETVRGDVLGLMERRGNWCQVRHESKGSVWIWAPSLGYASVNPLNARSWIGDATTPASEKSIGETFGRPTSVEMIGSHVAVYHYNNYIEEGKTLFGTHQLSEVKAYIDRKSRTVFHVEIVLPPFNGKANQAVTALGFPSVKSSGIDFEKARYINKFAGISLLELNFQKGDFEKITAAKVYRSSPELWRRKLDIKDKKVTIVNDELAFQMTLINNDQNHTYACPSAEVEMYEGSRFLGKVKVGPADIRVEPGQSVVATMPLDIDASRFDVKKIAARSEILQMYVLPRGE